MNFSNLKYMSIVPMLQPVNALDAAGELIPTAERCRQLPAGEYELCPLGVRLYYLYCASQRTNTGGKVPPVWERPWTELQVKQNSTREHIRYTVQMKIVRPAYIAHVSACCWADERPSGEIMPVLTDIARYLVAQDACRVAEIPGSSLTYWYTRRGDPVTMQDLYTILAERRTSDE